MKLPRGFYYFLILVEVLISLGHFALYASIKAFFPGLGVSSTTLLITLLILSVSFLAMTIITFKYDSWLLRVLNIIAAVWLPTFFYLLMASVAAIAIIGVWPGAIVIAPKVLFAIALGLIFYGIVNARITRVIVKSVKLPNLPQSWKGKAAVLVTDIHLGHILRYGFAGKIIEKINKLKPEIVFISGDFFDGVKTNFDDLANLFKSVKSKYGIYFVTGNHEEIAGYKVCETAVAKAGMHILENQKVIIDGLQIAGLAYYPESQESGDLVMEKLKAMNLDLSQPSILLKHVPNRAHEIANFGINLQLSGHTHHGQVWPFRYITNRVYKGFDHGLKAINSNFIYTSSGVGTWGPPLRIFTRSEIVKFVFE